MAKKQSASDKLKSMASALGKVVPKPIQQTPPAQPAQPIQPPAGFAEKVIEKARKEQQTTFRYHERPKNYTKTFLVRMTDDAYVKLMRASYVLFQGATDIAREAINKHLAELEAEHQKKTGKPFPPTPKE